MQPQLSAPPPVHPRPPAQKPPAPLPGMKPALPPPASNLRSQLVVRALFDYDPTKDSGLPGKGLFFKCVLYICWSRLEILCLELLCILYFIILLLITYTFSNIQYTGIT